MSQLPTTHSPTASTSSLKSTRSRSSSFFAFRSEPSAVGSHPPNSLHQAPTTHHQRQSQQRPAPRRTISQTRSQNASPPSQQSHDDPLHPEIRSIVSLTMAHNQKTYFSGPLIHKLNRNPDGHEPRKDEGWRDVWAQLNGTTLCMWDMGEVKIANLQGKEVPPSYVSLTEAVRAVSYLFYQRDPTNHPSPVRLCFRCYHTACNGDVSPSQIYQYHHPQHCRDKFPLLLLSFHTGSHLMGCCLPTLVLGENTPRGDIHGPSHSYHLEQWQGHSFDPHPRQT